MKRIETEKSRADYVSALHSSDEILQSQRPYPPWPGYLLPPVPVVVVAGVCAGFFKAEAGVLVVAGTGCLSDVFVTVAAAVG